METGQELRLEASGGTWLIAGAGSTVFATVNEYLCYLADRNYSPATVRAYGFDLLAFCRWLAGEEIGLGEVNTDALLRYLTACRHATVPGRPGPNVLTLQGQRTDGYAPATVCSHSRFIMARMIPSRTTGDLLAVMWELLSGLGAVPGRLIWDNEVGIGRRNHHAAGVAAVAGVLASRMVQVKP